MPRVFAVAAMLLAVAATLGACQAAGRTALKVGDCVNYSNAVDADGATIESTIVVDCAQPHAEEVFSVYADMSPSPTAFPGYQAIGATAQQVCQADFEEYVGVAWSGASYSIGYSGPTEADWAAGDHALACLLEDASGGQLTGSARGSAR